MNRVEIKLNKKGHLILIAIFSCCTVFAVWGLTLPDVELFYKFVLSAFVLLWLYQSYKWLAVINDPIITMTKSTIQIKNKNKDNIFLWSDIVDYTVDFKKSYDSVEYSLTILTHTGTATFQINGIEKKPDELKQMIDDFRV
jgi:hypothetical protein